MIKILQKCIKGISFAALEMRKYVGVNYRITRKENRKRLI